MFSDHLSFEKGAFSKTNKQALLALEPLVAPVRQFAALFWRESKKFKHSFVLI